MSYLRTPRTALLDGGIALCLLAPLMLLGAPALTTQGCGSSSRRAPPITTTTPPPSAPALPPPSSGAVQGIPDGSWQTTPAGALVWLPDWLDAGDAVAVLLEIDATEPLRDHRYTPDPIPAGVVGAPRDWRVVLMDPGPWLLNGTPVLGWTDYDLSPPSSHVETIYAALASKPLAPDRLGRRVPTLAHESGHAWASQGIGGPDRKALVDAYGHWSNP